MRGGEKKTNNASEIQDAIVVCLHSQNYQRVQFGVCMESGFKQTNNCKWRCVVYSFSLALSLIFADRDGIPPAIAR